MREPSGLAEPKRLRLWQLRTTLTPQAVRPSCNVALPCEHLRSIPGQAGAGPCVPTRRPMFPQTKGPAKERLTSTGIAGYGVPLLCCAVLA
jgi:hypothetical protein